jgi:hypothetical protein
MTSRKTKDHLGWKPNVGMIRILARARRVTREDPDASDRDHRVDPRREAG